MLSGFALTGQEKHFSHFVVINPEMLSSISMIYCLHSLELTSATNGRLASREREGASRGLPSAATYGYHPQGPRRQRGGQGGDNPPIIQQGRPRPPQ